MKREIKQQNGNATDYRVECKMSKTNDVLAVDWFSV